MYVIKWHNMKMLSLKCDNDKISRVDQREIHSYIQYYTILQNNNIHDTKS